MVCIPASQDVLAERSLLLLKSCPGALHQTHKLNISSVSGLQFLPTTVIKFSTWVLGLHCAVIQ